LLSPAQETIVRPPARLVIEIFRKIHVCVARGRRIFVNKVFPASLIVVAALSFGVSTAFADLVLVGPLNLTGSGFGALPRALTLQSHGPSANTESGCIKPDGSGGLSEGSGACGSARDVGGDETPPLGHPKEAAPSLVDLRITSGGQIGVLFDVIQSQNGSLDVVTIDDLTLKLYNGTNLIFSAFGSFADLLTNPGNGITDYVFALDMAQASAFNAVVGANGGFSNSALRLALDSTISFDRQSAGPDSYVIVNRATIPEPSTVTLLGLGLVGLAVKRRRPNRR
jgi:hypothetical protein